LAVSFFFVLSGFLLTRTYSDRWTEGSYKQFIIARFARIYPCICPRVADPGTVLFSNSAPSEGDSRYSHGAVMDGASF
jgi:hypothetical protein